MAEQPAAIGALVDWLVSQGFTLVDEKYSREHFGDWTRTLEAPTLRVSIVRERGTWDIGAAPAQSHRVYSITAWSACLGLSYGGNPWSYENQMRFLREHLGTMVRAAERNHSMNTCLDQAERSFLEREIGWPPDLRLDEVGRLEPPRSSAALQREAAIRLAREKRQRKLNKARRGERQQ